MLRIVEIQHCHKSNIFRLSLSASKLKTSSTAKNRDSKENVVKKQTEKWGVMSFPA
jgi:hypothetical protein